MGRPDHEQNRRFWDEIADIHYRHPDYRVAEFLAGRSTLRPIERRLLGEVGGRTLLHLFCQFGLDTLSWARLGADATGVDISGRSIALAGELRRQTGLRAEFVQADVLELIGRLDRTFDIVFQSYGTHHWISDLDLWARTVAHYLGPGGVLCLVDIHPLAPVCLEGARYFARGARRRRDPDYADKDYRPAEESVQWAHTLGEVVTALAGAGLAIDRLEEFDGFCYPYREGWVERDGYWYPPEGPPPYPMLFALLARKP
ncbi:MAG TPA: class I SAM-dependent methyltransferase [candidate division Zixibacteria bacterium]|nr:class I SAM-dependent methyltransferase [candidate division Zixibacteria bacterium]MDD4917714.1 class I SAM-dependent methyltransferase [candidate division Zixibacteria bacterium]MDM7973350.1 class I SAM-dependent methyltransferase [candidate division Zixibacteria bacterium]HOD67083.1 class I SAM-dependent methyltransferase [candidate division Zixibacteria bacterium]HOZ06947.1 class I SAM-dependent methyltransferase [candidate division Zixibacteria bacterium]